MSSLKGKVAVVTGASRGIGRGIAERLAQDGATVVVNYTKSAGEAEKVVAGIKTRGGAAVALQADVSRVGDIRRLFQETSMAFGRLDILINNAGLFFGPSRFWKRLKKNTIRCLPSMRRDSSLPCRKRRSIWRTEAAS